MCASRVLVARTESPSASRASASACKARILRLESPGAVKFFLARSNAWTASTKFLNISNPEPLSRCADAVHIDLPFHRPPRETAGGNEMSRCYTAQRPWTETVSLPNGLRYTSMHNVCDHDRKPKRCVLFAWRLTLFSGLFASIRREPFTRVEARNIAIRDSLMHNTANTLCDATAHAGEKLPLSKLVRIARLL